MQQERRRAVHADLRRLLEEELGPEPWPGLLYRQGNFMRGQISVPFTESPPVEIIYGSVGLLGSLGFAIWHVTGNGRAIGLVLVLLVFAGALAAVLLVRGLIRIRWWWRARRIALRWCAEHEHVMPYDLRW